MCGKTHGCIATNREAGEEVLNHLIDEKYYSKNQSFIIERTTLHYHEDQSIGMSDIIGIRDHTLNDC